MGAAICPVPFVCVFSFLVLLIILTTRDPVILFSLYIQNVGPHTTVILFSLYIQNVGPHTTVC